MVQDQLNKAPDMDVVEVFAGASRVSRLATSMGLKAVALDKLLCDGNNVSNTNCMDINTSASFLLPGSIYCARACTQDARMSSSCCGWAQAPLRCSYGDET